MGNYKIDNPILLDTHVIIWSLLKPEELSVDIKKNHRISSRRE